MKTSRTKLGITITVASVLWVIGTCALSAQSTAQAPTTTKWNVLVERISPGETNIDPAFQEAIYENMIEELGKTRRFNQVFRSGDRKAKEVPDVLILKTEVEKYKPGSETRRAVTTFGGATKLKVNSQLCTQDGQVVFQSLVDGNVRFLGGNLRATHNLARHVANELKQASLPNTKSDNTSRSSSRDVVAQTTHKPKKFSI